MVGEPSRLVARRVGPSIFGSAFGGRSRSGSAAPDAPSSRTESVPRAGLPALPATKGAHSGLVTEAGPARAKPIGQGERPRRPYAESHLHGVVERDVMKANREGHEQSHEHRARPPQRWLDGFEPSLRCSSV